jgi:hypothetical protein
MRFRITRSFLSSDYIANTEDLRQALVNESSKQNILSFFYKKSSGEEINSLVKYDAKNDILIDNETDKPVNWRALQEKATGQYFG